MGIHDRHYIRDRPEAGFGTRSAMAMRGWSVTTWIIIICVSVFVIDGFTPQHRYLRQPAQLVPGGNVYLDEGAVLTPDAVPNLNVEPRTGPRAIPVVPLLDQRQGVPIGVMEVFPMNGVIAQYLHFSTQRGFLRIEFWRLIGFQFLHADLWHLLVNMLVLFFFGSLVERYVGSKRYLAFYLLCGICGALLYTALNLGGYAMGIFGYDHVRVPGLLFNDPYTPLIGASAGVFGVLMAGAYLAPRATVLLFFIIPMQLRTLAYALVAFSLFILIFGGRNPGGEAGHLGGAIAGFYFIRNPRHLHGFFDFLGWADPTSHHYKKGRSGQASPRPQRGAASQREVDRILEKISREGIQSLTDQERRILREASRR